MKHFFCRELLYSMTTLCFFACFNKEKAPQDISTKEAISIFKPDTIIDCAYTFAEAIAGTKAPQKVIDELVLFDVLYLSTDEKIHQGQILCNKKIEKEVQDVFRLMIDSRFMVEKAIPIVRYHWNDSLSMADNNTYSFCYRNVSYSKHAQGMAIDINPRLNPLRYKHIEKPNQPLGAVLDTSINGTFYPDHFIVKAFRKRGFRWGHNFTKYYDDHHFERDY